MTVYFLSFKKRSYHQPPNVVLIYWSNIFNNVFTSAPPAVAEDASRYTNGKSLGHILIEDMHFIACFFRVMILFS